MWRPGGSCERLVVGFMASQADVFYCVASVLWDLNRIPCESTHFYSRKISSQRLFGICVQEMFSARAVRFSFSRLRQSSSTEW